MKQFVIKQADLDNLMHMVQHRYINMLENGTAEKHREQAREQYSEIVKDWISGVER